MRIPIKSIILEMTNMKQGMPKFGENLTGVRHPISTPSGGTKFGKRTGIEKEIEHKKRNPTKTNFDIRKGDNTLLKTLIRQNGMTERQVLKSNEAKE